MASDLSSGCTEAIGILDEKEEGEISLEDVSSSEEGHMNYDYGDTAAQCSNCLSTQHSTMWCTSTKLYRRRNQNKRDAVHGKENRHHTKDPGSTGTKHVASTLQEKNDDLVPISSDSDMEIVGLLDSSKQIIIRTAPKTRTKKKRKKKRSHKAALNIDDFVSVSSTDFIDETAINLKHEDLVVKENHTSRQHHREPSPVHRSDRSRIIAKSPPRSRHRSSPTRKRSPFRKSHSPVLRSRSPILKKSPRKARSPKRSPHRSPVRTLPRKDLRTESSVSSNMDMCGNVSRLLKKVRHLDSLGNKEHVSSLKEKLSHMIKGISDNNGNVTDYVNRPAEKFKKEGTNDPDDEEDLALLRQKALETKQNKQSKCSAQVKSETERQMPRISDDHNEEDLELRMIALRSAVMKKYQDRVQRGIKTGRHRKIAASRSESPFSQSFLDSIPIPGEEYAESKSPPGTPPTSTENVHTEDMDLDTDVEREKEKLPYSPTDKITSTIPVDTEMLGIQPSDVSFINLNETNNSSTFNNTYMNNMQQNLEPGISDSKIYFPNTTYYTTAQDISYPAMNVLYSPSDPTTTPQSDFTDVQKQNSHIGISHFTNMPSNAVRNLQASLTTHNLSDVSLSQETPYSPSDTPIYDPDLPQTLPVCAPTTTSEHLNISTSLPYNSHESTQQSHPFCIYPQSDFQNKMDVTQGIKSSDDAEIMSLGLGIGSRSSSVSVSPSSMVTIDYVPEIDRDLSSPVDQKDPLPTESTPEQLSSDIKNITEEPFYMQGVPDVTKDVNRIPTLINRTLVPAPILKSNKQLQQPLLAKKPDTQPEPTFKSADMQPVTVDKETPNAGFKPIKLVPVTKKPQSVLLPVAVFDNCLNDDSDATPSEDKSVPLQENTPNVTPMKETSVLETNNSVTEINNKPLHTESTVKRKKRTRRGGRKDKERKSKYLERQLLRQSMKKDDGATSDINKDNVENNIPKTSSPQNSQKELANEVHECSNENKETFTSVSETVNSMKTPDTDERNQASQNKAQKSPTCAENKAVNDNTNIKDNADKQTECKESTTETRRQSLDEDEEALRAILLASLAKRAKCSDVATPTSSASITTVNTSMTLQQETSPAETVASTSTANTTTVTSGHVIPSTSPKYSSSSNVSANDKLHTNTAVASNNNIQQQPISNSSAERFSLLSTMPDLRKRPSVPLKGPPKKIIRKVSIPASTKVVNNAKKYQNMMIQKKLNLQKVASLYNIQKSSDTFSSKVKATETKWSANSKPSVLSDSQRLVINLESDTESDSESDHQTARVPPVIANNTERPILTIPTTDFEKKVDQFLQDVRKKQETAAATKPTMTQASVAKEPIHPQTSSASENKNLSNLHTPPAVRHLPASQQEEYHRLKQQILERERLKSRRAVETDNSNQTLKNKIAQPTSLSAGSDNSNKELTCSKQSSSALLKSQKNPQLNSKEKNSTNMALNNATNLNLAKSQTHAEKVTVTNTSKRVSSIQLQGTRGITKTITNYNPSTSNKSRTEQYNLQNETENVLDPMHVTSGSKLENTTSKQTNNKVSPTLKVLTKDEVNHKYIQIQVKQNADKRIVTINDKENNTATNKSINIVSEIKNKSATTKHKDERNTTEISNKEDELTIGKKTIDNNESIDSQASTVHLSTGKENIENTESDITQSTLTLSQYEMENNNTSPASTKCKDDDSDDDTCSSFESTMISNNRKSIEGIWATIRNDVKIELSTLMNLPEAQQRHHLMETEHELVIKRYTVLEDLSEMSGNLRQWDMERDLQMNLVAEVKKLREQLRIAEEKLQLQRSRINSMGPKVVEAHRKINNGRRECFKLTKICSALGSKINGEDYKVPEAGAQLLSTRLKEVANHTRQLSKKKVPFVNISDLSAPFSTPTKQQESTVQTLECNVGSAQTENEPPLESSTDANENTDQPSGNECRTASTRNETNSESTAACENETLPVEIDKGVEDKDSRVHNNMHGTIECNNPSSSKDTIPSDTSALKDFNGTQQTEETTQSSTNNPCFNQSTSDAKSTKQGSERQVKKIVEPYVSVLTHLKVPRNTNPNGFLCPYELRGTCSDEDCQFIHQSRNIQ